MPEQKPVRASVKVPPEIMETGFYKTVKLLVSRIFNDTYKGKPSPINAGQIVNSTQHTAVIVVRCQREEYEEFVANRFLTQPGEPRKISGDSVMISVELRKYTPIGSKGLGRQYDYVLIVRNGGTNVYEYVSDEGEISAASTDRDMPEAYPRLPED